MYNKKNILYISILILNTDCINVLARSVINCQKYLCSAQNGTTYVSKHDLVRVNDHEFHNKSFTIENSKGS